MSFLRSNVGKLGDDGDAIRWLKLKREEVDDNGPFSRLFVEVRRKFGRCDLLADRVMSACVYVLVRSRVGGILENAGAARRTKEEDELKE